MFFNTYIFFYYYSNMGNSNSRKDFSDTSHKNYKIIEYDTLRKSNIFPNTLSIYKNNLTKTVINKICHFLNMLKFIFSEIKLHMK